MAMPRKPVRALKGSLAPDSLRGQTPPPFPALPPEIKQELENCLQKIRRAKS